MKKIFMLLTLTLFLLVSCNGEKGVENSLVDIEKNEDIETFVNTNTEDAEKFSDSFNDSNKENAVNGDKQSSEKDVTVAENDKKDEEKEVAKNTIAPEFSDDRWIIKPSYTFDSLVTFGMSGYSIYQKNGKYGILDMLARGIGTGDYSYLFHCPTHGLSCPDILEVPIKMREDLYLSPDCGYRYSKEGEVTYVFDPTRDRVYVTGYSDGIFKIVDITETEYFSKNERYTVVLYDCDADIMMYEGIGMPDIEAIFASESKEMHYGVIDRDMDYVIACIYDEIRDGNDCYIVKKDGKYGYSAISGREYYPCVFTEANTAYKGAAWVKYNGKWGTVRF